MSAPVFDRDFILSRIDVDPETGCWNWTGCLGAGTRRAMYNRTYAYRISYEVFVGPIPGGLQINHHCDNPACVNPEHIYAGTRSQNSIDMYSRGRHDNGLASRTHCKNGHEFTEENTRYAPDRRACRACARERARERYWRLRDQEGVA
jgi:hypothetical protein